MQLNLIALQDAAAGGGLSSIFMIVALVAIFYFMMIRPQQKKQKEIKKFREGITKGDSVITAGGIYGKVTEIRDTSFLISIAPSVTIRVDKGSVYPSAAEAAEAQQQQQKQ